MYLYKNLSKRYGFELELLSFRKFGHWGDIICLDGGFSYGFKDHSPSFCVFLMVFGFLVLDISIYNLYHAEEPNRMPNSRVEYTLPIDKEYYRDLYKNDPKILKWIEKSPQLEPYEP